MESLTQNKIEITKNIKMTKPLAKLVKLFTATVIIASLDNKNKTIVLKQKFICVNDFTGKHYDENRYNLRMP